MKIKHRVATYAAAAVAGAAALTGALPSVAEAAEFKPCDLRVKLHEIQGWDANNKYNIIVWKESAFGAADLQGVVMQGHIRTEECKVWNPSQVNYFWAAFREGHFTRKGDGGYRNWAFSGRYEKYDNYAKFLPR